ncbi:MAG: FAD-dependent oxidoreductase [Micromonosporaceae bacterium]|nr:FAD-dependent oxidoreductase [Micromonosporaceae bacterium]
MTARSAIIVGSGAGGCVAAMTLAEAGWDVTIIEKGPNPFTNLAGPGPIGTSFSNDELKKLRYFEKPDPLACPRTFRSGPDDVASYQGSVAELPQVVGGGTVHWDAKTPRFWDLDFQQLSAHGPAPDADVADWPFEYAELAPCYDEMESLLGVQGDAAALPDANRRHAPRSAPYPMPPGPPQRSSRLLADAARATGVAPFPIPAAINSVPHDDRPACNNCGFCAEYGCPTHARGSALGLLRRALRTGRVELAPNTTVTRVAERAVEWVRLGGDGTTRGRFTADVVVLAASAIETARLALLSELPDASGRIGQRLMFHYYVDLVGVFLGERLHSHRGRSATHCFEDYADPGFPGASEMARQAGLPYLRGGLVELGLGMHPIAEAKAYQRVLRQIRPDKPFGADFKALMRASLLRDRYTKIAMVGNDHPYRTNNVTLDPKVRDVYDLPVARVTYSLGKHEQVGQMFYGMQLMRILEHAGADAITSSVCLNPGGFGAPDSVHVLGGMQLGANPATSVCDPYGRVHGTESVYVADGSVFVTSGAQNPTLTLMAVALRSMRRLAGAPTRPPAGGESRIGDAAQDS